MCLGCIHGWFANFAAILSLYVATYHVYPSGHQTLVQAPSCSRVLTLQTERTHMLVRQWCYK